MPTTETCPWYGGSQSIALLGMNALAASSAAALVGEVENVTEPRWNSKDRGPWCPPLDNPFRAFVYRDVTIKVTQPIFTSGDLEARPGQTVTFRTLGDGTDGGRVSVTLPDGTTIYRNQPDGRFDVGQEVLVMLAPWADFPTANGPESVYSVVNGWQGRWTIDRQHDLAKNIQAVRTVPFSRLVDRITRERNMGRAAERDEASKNDPLAE
jgi:hypothetical protein